MASKRDREEAMLSFRRGSNAIYIKNGKKVSKALGKYDDWFTATADTKKKRIRKIFQKYSISDKLKSYYVSNLYKISDISGGGLDTVNKEITTGLLKSKWAGGNPLYKRLEQVDSRAATEVYRSINTSIAESKSIINASRSLFDGFGNDPDLIPVNVLKGDINHRMGRIKVLSSDPSRRQELQTEIAKFRKEVDNLGGASGRLTALEESRKDFIKAVESGIEDNIEKSYNVAIAQKGRYIADRIAKTEATRANFEGSIKSYIDDEDVVAMKWILNGNHIDFDICDMHADLDLGMGAGVYPLDQFPSFPAHPYCSCMADAVFAHELPQSRIDDEEGRTDKYLKGLSNKKRNVLMGKGCAEWYKNGDISATEALKSQNVLHDPLIRIK